MKTGNRVRVERDEKLYPSRGTWPDFRSRVGTIVQVNRDHERPHLTEYGVTFGAVSRRTDGRGAFDWKSNDVAWFKLYELTVIGRVAAVRHADDRDGPSEP